MTFKVEIQESRQSPKRWSVEGRFVKKNAPEGMEPVPFTISVRQGWFNLELVQGPLFNEIMEHFVARLGDPQSPPACSAGGDCSDEVMYLTTAWELSAQQVADISGLLTELLGKPIFS
jgi:hypothetical protein